MNSRNLTQEKNRKSVAVSRLSAAHFNQSRIDLAPPTDGVGGKNCFNYADQGSPTGHEEKQPPEAEAQLFGADSTRNTNAPEFTSVQIRIVPARFNGNHQRIIP
jgi:hypothetical protein